jgi:thiol-disulfide isomerase/thioredoxin
VRWGLILVVLLATAPAWADAIMASETERAWLGVGLGDGADGILITAVIDDSPADLCGIAAGDEILVVEGTRVSPGQQLRDVIGRYRPGDRVRITLLREGRRLETSAILGEALAPNEILARMLVGRRAPAFELEAVRGLTSGTLADHAGRVVVIDFFATHCQPCRDAHAALLRAAEQRGGMVVLAISEESPDALAMYAQSAMAELTVLHDPLAEVRRAYVPYFDSRPTLVVVDHTGVVRYAGIAGDGGVVTSAAALANVDQALFAVDRALRRR